MSKILLQHLADLRLDLKDAASVWTDGELTRCIERAVGDLSRFLPRERVLEHTFDFTVESESFTTPAASDTDYFVTTYDMSATADGQALTLAHGKPDFPRPVLITVTDANASLTQLAILVVGQDSDDKYQEEFFYLSGGLVQTGKKYFSNVTAITIKKIVGNGAADTLIIGTGSHIGVFVALANKPIKQDSESITGYTRDADYKMDYVRGRISMKTGGSMVAGTAYTIAEYTKSQISVDLKDIADDLIRVDRIEYPAGSIPQVHHTLEVFGSILTLSGGTESQAEASDTQHIIIRYLASHVPPGTSSPGSYPSFLDYTVQLAAEAYALFIKAIQYEQQAITDFASARTALTSIAAVHVLAKAALVLSGTQLASAVAAALYTAIDGACTAAASAATAAEANGVTGMGYLTSGAGYIITVNQAGKQVGDQYASFAAAAGSIAAAVAACAAARAREAEVRASEPDKFTNAGRSFIDQANAYLIEIAHYLQEASSDITLAQQNISLAEKFRAEAIERRNEAWAVWGAPNQVAPMYQLGATLQVAQS